MYNVAAVFQTSGNEPHPEVLAEVCSPKRGMGVRIARESFRGGWGSRGPGSAAEIDIAFFPLDDHVAATSDVVEVRPPAFHVPALNVELHGVSVGSGRRLPQQALDDLIAHGHRPSVVTVIHHRT
jgi:hypothetical protein